jgi:putative NIF3 family GTP cyclohydrolase 1 type 2
MKHILSFAVVLYVLHSPADAVRNIVSIASAAGVQPVQLLSH